MENQILLEIESLMLADNFLKAEKLIESHTSALKEDKDFSFFKLYIEYLKTLDVHCFRKINGFSESNREHFFKHIHNFPIRPIDDRVFIKIISRFFSNETVKVYQSYCDVYQNRYKKQTYDATHYPEVCYKYILDGDLERGWKSKILIMRSQIPPFVDVSKFCQPLTLQDSTILVTPEQGFGDNIFYFRMWLQFCKNNQSTKIIFVARDELFELFTEANDCDNLSVYSFRKEYILYNKLHFDYFCFDYFAPLYLYLKNNNISNYPQLINDEVSEKSIGIFWGTELRTDNKIRLKNIPLSVFWENLNIDEWQRKGYEIHSLQLKHSENDLDFLREKNVAIHQFENFQQTANIIKKCEQIFSIDTGVLHLSEALGKNTTCVFNYYKGFHYDKKNGLYPSIKTINLCDKVFEHFSDQLNNT